MLRSLGSASCDITHKTGGTICSGRWVLHLVISNTRQGVRFVTGSGCCILRWHNETGGTICSGRWVLHFVISHTQERGYDLLRALGSESCNIKYETGGTSCYGQWVLHLAVAQRDRGTIYYGQWVLRLVISAALLSEVFVGFTAVGLDSNGTSRSTLHYRPIQAPHTLDPPGLPD